MTKRKKHKYAKIEVVKTKVEAIKMAHRYFVNAKETIKKLVLNDSEGTQNGKLMSYYNIVYQNLHLFGYYRNGVDVEMIKSGFSQAKDVINMLRK